MSLLSAACHVPLIFHSCSPGGRCSICYGRNLMGFLEWRLGICWLVLDYQKDLSFHFIEGPRATSRVWGGVGTMPPEETHWHFWPWDPHISPHCWSWGPRVLRAGRGARGMPRLRWTWHGFVGKSLLISIVIFGYVYYKIFSLFLEPRFGESVYLAFSLLPRPLQWASWDCPSCGRPPGREDVSSSGRLWDTSL